MLLQMGQPGATETSRRFSPEKLASRDVAALRRMGPMRDASALVDYVSAEKMPRSYVPWPEKHKWPKGYGSLCPRMPDGEPAGLLARAISLPEVAANALWVASGRWCFCAHRSPHAGPDAWHGFPVIGGEVDERVISALLERGVVTAREARRLRQQRSLPEAWP
jgi:hypothetical protein